MRLLRCLSLAALLCSCASRPPPATPADLGALTAGSPLTVVVFFSAHCPCQAAHDARLIELHRAYAPRGVRLVLVDAEAGASDARASAEARRRGYPFPIQPDPEGRLADALGATFATYTVVLDTRGAIRYQGGIDSDRKDLHDDAHLFVRDALDDLLAGRDPRVSEGKALGCALQRR